MQEGKLDDAIILLEIVYSGLKSDPRGTFNAVKRDLQWAYCEKNRLSEGRHLTSRKRMQASQLITGGKYRYPAEFPLLGLCVHPARSFETGGQSA